jgi:hypothetical protein
MLKVLALEEPARLELAAAAREQAAKFSTALFETVRSPLLASQQQDSGQVLHRAVRDGTQPSPCESTAGLRPSSPPRCSRWYAALSLRVNSRNPAKFSTALFEMVRSPLLASQQQDSCTPEAHRLDFSSDQFRGRFSVSPFKPFVEALVPLNRLMAFSDVTVANRNTLGSGTGRPRERMTLERWHSPNPNENA